MNNAKIRFIWILCLLILSVFNVYAQDDATSTPAPDDEACPVLVRQALDATEENCEFIGSNEVCYGHSILDAAARAGLDDFKFDEPGDIEDIIEMQSLSLSAMDTLRDIWGVILMNVQAGGDLLEEANVTFVVFGDTDIEASYGLLELTATSNANIRNLPALDAEVVQVVEEGDVLLANGRTEANDWLRVLIDGGLIGWVSGDIVSTDADLEPLEIVPLDEDDNPLALFGPMEAFYFESGRDDAPCQEAPNSGMMIQTPEGAASVTLWIDEVIIELNGTAFVQAQANGDLTVNTVEGTADVTALGETRTAIAGTQVSVSLDEDLRADEVPDDATAYDADDVASLPTEVLPRQIEVSAPRELIAGVPAEGDWRFAWGVESLTCPDGTVVPFESSGGLTPITVEEGGEIVNRGGPYTRQGEGVYARTYIDGNGNLYQDTLTVVSPTQINGQSIIDFATSVCSLTVPFSLTFVR